MQRVPHSQVARRHCCHRACRHPSSWTALRNLELVGACSQRGSMMFCYRGMAFNRASGLLTRWAPSTWPFSSTSFSSMFLLASYSEAEVPTARKNCRYFNRRRALFRKTWPLQRHRFKEMKNWLICTAKGSEMDYMRGLLAQYNVMIGECKSHILPHKFGGGKQWEFSHKPNFHMTP